MQQYELDLVLGYNPTRKRSDGKIPIGLGVAMGDPDELDFIVLRTGEYVFEVQIAITNIDRLRHERTVRNQVVAGRVGETLCLKEKLKLKIVEPFQGGLVITVGQ